MSNIKYLRKFIMLEKLNSNTKIKGHSKIEVRDGRGKLEVNIDGIKDVNKVYDILFLTNKGFKEDVAYFGRVSDVGGGKAFYKKDFNPKNVLHSNKSIDDYNIILVKASDSEILYGYIHRKEKQDILSLLRKKQNVKKEDEEAKTKEPEEKNQKVNEEKAIKEENVKEKEIKEVTDIEEEKIEHEEESEVKKEGIIEDKENKDENEEAEKNKIEFEAEKLEAGEKEKLEEEKIEIKESEKLVDEIEENAEKEINEAQNEKEEEETFEVEDMIKKEEIEYRDTESNIGDDILNKSEKDLEEYYRYKESIAKENKNKENTENYKSSNSLNILNYFNQVEPFKINLKEYSFWEITEDSVNIRRGFLPFYNYVVNMRYPYTLMHKMNSPSKQIRKYRHYLFGIVSEDETTVKHFVYGIPGKFTRGEQPFRGMSGFTTWLESKDSGDERLGYWLIHIDANTGRVITPLRPTSPLK